MEAPSDDDAALGDRVQDSDFEARRLLANVRERLAGVTADAIEVGRYRLGDKIGAGAAGVVYEAYDPELDRKVAIKIVEAHDEVLAARFLREARALAELSHPNVVSVYDAGRTGRRVWISMELVIGDTLRGWLDATRRSEPEIIAMFVQAGRGLAAAHAQGIVHRDFKPANVLVGADGRPRVGDFGLAREVDTEGASPASTLPEGSQNAVVSESLTRTGAVLGTPAYMAPEQACGEPVDPRADQFSFCVALFEGLVGHRPFAGKTVLEIVDAIRAGIDRSEERQLPAVVRRPLVQGLAADAADRHRDLNTLLSALQPTRHPVASWVLLGAGVTVAVGAGIAVWDDEAAASCREPGVALMARWTDEYRPAIETAFTTIDAAGTSEIWQRLSPSLEQHVRDWGVTRDAVCELPADTEYLDRTQWCMQGRRRALLALLDRLTHADTTTVHAAAAAEAELSDAARCLDADYVAATDPPPPPQLRAAVDSVLQHLLAGRTATSIGDTEAALVEYDAAAGAAEALGYGPLLAQVLADQGRAHAQAPDGVTILQRAHALATEHSRHDAALRAAVGLVWAFGVARQQPDEAEAWLRHAQASLERRGDRSEDRRLYVNAAASLASVRGQFDAAIPLYEELVELRAAADGSGLHLAIAQRHLGRALLYAGRNDEARARLEEALQTATEAVGSTHPIVGAVYQALAGVSYGQQRLDDAERQFGQAATIHEAAEQWGALALDIGGLASVAQVKLRNEEALAYHRRAIELLERAHGPDHPNVARQLDNYSTALQATGQYDQAEPPLRRSLEIKRAALGPEHRDLALTHTHLGSLAVMRGDPAAAEIENQRAYDILLATVGPEHSLTAIALAGLAHSRLAQAKYEEALQPAEDAVRIFQNVGAFSSQIADAKATLAGVLVGPAQGGCRGDDRPICQRARTLAADARQRYVALGPALQPQIDALDAWTPSHL